MRTISIVIIFLASICCCSKSDSNGKISSIQASLIEKYKYDDQNLKDIEKTISILIDDKKNSDQSTQSVLGEITEKIIKDLAHLQNKNLKIVTLNYLVLYQYIEAYNEETLNEICRNIFINNTKIILNALVVINNYLLPEFQNADFYNSLYSSVCDFPNSYYQSGKLDKIEKDRMVKKLLQLKNSENKNIVDYVLNNKFKI